MLYDISPTIDRHLRVWPGDTAPAREVLSDLARGDSVTLSTLHSTVHVGAHADAPSHYGLGAASIEQQCLDDYLGRCDVVRVNVRRGTRIVPGDLVQEFTSPRVLLATGTYPDPRDFNEDFAALSVDLIDWLHDRRVRLIGIDTPSVDLFGSKDLPAHRRMLAHGMAILEGLVLEAVPPGAYELIALPLKLAGFDGSPVRAVLRTTAS